MVLSNPNNMESVIENCVARFVIVSYLIVIYYTKNAVDQRLAFNEAKSIWDQAAQKLLVA